MEAVSPREHALQFTGEGSTYFRIWIVNLALTIVTIGFYSPWAKVRRLRYIYGNTLLDGSPFEFHGNPLALLKGRLIGVLLLVGYTQAAKVSLALWLVVVAAIAVALPWLLWKSQKFRLANSSYRGIRFGFDGTLRSAYAVFALPIVLFMAPYVCLAALGLNGAPARQPGAAVFAPVALLFLLLALAYPWIFLRVYRYFHARARIGSARFSFSASLAGAYGLAFSALGLFALAMVLALLLGTIAGLAVSWIARHGAWIWPGAAAVDPGVSGRADSVIGISAGFIAGYMVVLCVYPIFAALKQNFLWGKTALDGAPLQSRAQGMALLRIAAANALLMLLTLGLYWPFALMRSLRYQLGVISWTGDPERIVAQGGDAAVSATGEETMELLGLDFSL